MGKWLTFTFALTGRREWGHGTQGVALGYGLAGLSARAGPQTRLFSHNLPPLNISILNTLMHCLVCIERGALRPTVYQYTSTQAANRLALSRNWLRSALSGALHTTTPMRRLTRVVGLPKMRTSASSSHVSSNPL